jgi:hypothetical protein
MSLWMSVSLNIARDCVIGYADVDVGLPALPGSEVPMV